MATRPLIDLDQHRSRVRLYLVIMLVIDVAAYASDGINLLLDKPLPDL